MWMLLNAGPVKHRWSRWNNFANLSTSWEIVTSELVATILDFALPVCRMLFSIVSLNFQFPNYGFAVDIPKISWFYKKNIAWYSSTYGIFSAIYTLKPISHCKHYDLTWDTFCTKSCKNRVDCSTRSQVTPESRWGKLFTPTGTRCSKIIGSTRVNSLDMFIGDVQWRGFLIYVAA